MSGDSTTRKTKSITVRFSQDEAQAFSDLADEYHMTLSEVIRSATSGELDRYLGRIKYVDKDQGRAINANIIILGNVMMDVGDQLRKIGVNFNQIARRINAGDMKALNDTNALISRDELDTIIRRVERMTDTIGEELKRLVE